MTQPKRGNHNLTSFNLKIYSRRTVPGPGTYFVKTKKDIENEQKNLKQKGKTSKAIRMNFLMEYEYLSALVPGPG